NRGGNFKSAQVRALEDVAGIRRGGHQSHVYRHPRVESDAPGFDGSGGGCLIQIPFGNPDRFRGASFYIAMNVPLANNRIDGKATRNLMLRHHNLHAVVRTPRDTRRYSGGYAEARDQSTEFQASDQSVDQSNHRVDTRYSRPYDRKIMPQQKSQDGTKPSERVFLIDSMSHIFRAFYAPLANRAAPLMTSKGQMTQAVFIFTNMLRKLLQDEQPKYIAAVFESKEKTFRHETFADYKATRLEMPDDLASQMAYIMRLCEAYNIPIISVPGFEADDVIGALASQTAERGLQAVIVSNDKDMCQLVRDPLIVCLRQNSQVVKRKEPVPPIEWCDEAWDEKKFGVPAGKLVDLLGLMGDSSDNIRGAPGDGPE